MDDNETNRLLLKGQLDSQGCRQEEAADGQTALKKLQEAAREGDTFRLAILDMRMPGIDG